MILVVAATEFEMNSLRTSLSKKSPLCQTLITGVGPTETAMVLTRFLCHPPQEIELVVMFGIAGAYIQPKGQKQPELLDICLAKREVFGDLGVSLDGYIEYLDHSLVGTIDYELDPAYQRNCLEILNSHNVNCYCGNFITVSSVSGTVARGEMLRVRWDGLCENMEGAAAAKVCREFSIPFVELRSISNLVEDRNMENWQLEKACLKAGQTTLQLLKGLMK